MPALKISAVLGALDLDQPLGGAANRANLLGQGGAGALGGSFVTQRADHGVNFIALLLGAAPQRVRFAQISAVKREFGLLTVAR